MQKIIVLSLVCLLSASVAACASQETQQIESVPVFVTPTPDPASPVRVERTISESHTSPASLPTKPPTNEVDPTPPGQATVEATITSIILSTDPPTNPSPKSHAPETTLAGPNLYGQVMVLEYHLIEGPDDPYRRTADSFRADLERLHNLGYYPANLIDLSLGFPDLPPGKKPVVITFDDSDISQFNYLSDGIIDPNSAVGIILDFHHQHPEDWPLRGTFYVLQEVDAPERIVFGQPEFAAQKLRWLIDQGFEVGSHTISHFDLSTGSDEQIQWQLAVSQGQLESLLPGYDVRSLSAPFGNFPDNLDLLRQGVWEGEAYTYANTVMAWGGPSPSPYSPEFEPYSIPRIPVTDAELNYWLDYFEQNPDLYYVSGGE